MSVIAFTGKKRSGKDSAATVLIRNSPEQYIPISFAQPLKFMCERWWGGHGIPEQDREIVRVFRVQFRDIVRGMVWLGLPEKSSFAFTERVIKVFSDYVVGVDDRFIDLECSYRTILQLVGTDVCRHFQQNIWIDKASEAIDNAQALRKDVIITDLRFDNEAKMLKEKYNAFIVEVVRDLCYNNHQENGIHSSEIGVSAGYIDSVILNTGSLEEYESRVTGLIGGMNGGFND